MGDYNYDNEIIELESDEKEEESLEEETSEELEAPKKKKRRKRSIKDRWDDLSKGKKLGIIIGIGTILLIITGIVLYFVFFNHEEEKPKDPVIVEKENYRYEDGKLIFLDKYDSELGSYECENKDSNKCMVAKSDYSADTFDRVKSVNGLGEELPKNSSVYYDTFIFVRDGDKKFLYNFKKQEEVLEVTNFKTYGTEKDLIVVANKENLYGLIELTSSGYEYKIKPTYENLGIVEPSLVYLVAKDNDGTYVVDIEGKKLSDSMPGDIMSVSSDYLTVKENNNYSLYTYAKEKILEDYDFIGFHNNVISLVKGNRLYMVDNKIQKLYEDGLRISGNDYVKRFIYDDNNELIDTKIAYEVAVNANEVLITIGEDSKVINLNEALVSASLSYMSYFDGTLYFYKDDSKEELLSTYKCNNKNDIKAANSTLNNCNIYSIDNKKSGIYNDKYVFIYDSMDNNNPKIYLYDLKAKKVKGTYTSVTINNGAEMDLDVKHIDTSSSYFVCKSGTGENNGKYGVIEILSDNVKGRIEFKYKNIKTNGKYYLMEMDNLYAIYDNNFNKISDDFAYADIYDNYYVGINYNTLNVYKFTDRFGILTSSLPVSDNKYQIEFNEKGFKIIINNTSYNYDKDGRMIYGE